MLYQLRRLSISEEIRGPTAVFLSQAILNLSFFFITFVATIVLNVQEFAQLSLALGWVGTVASVLGFGMDQSALKLSIERGTSGFIALNFYFKGLIMIAALCILAISVTTSFLTFEAIVLVAGAGVAFWSSTRVLEQFRRQFKRLAALNLALAVGRVVAGGLSLFSHSWMLIVFAVHFLAQAPIHVFALSTMARELRPEVKLQLLPTMLKTAPIMFASSTLFASITVIIQQTMYNRGQVDATSAFGIVLLFSAPLTLFIGTLRLYLLPYVLDPESREHPILNYGYKGIALLGAIAVIGYPLLVTLFVQLIYGHRQPQASEFAAWYLVLTGLATCFSMLNMRAQRGNLIIAELVTNGLRFVAVSAGCRFISDPLHLIIFCATVYPIVELLLFGFLIFVDKRKG